MRKWTITVVFGSAGGQTFTVEHVDVVLAIIEALTDKTVTATLRNGYFITDVKVVGPL